MPIIRCIEGSATYDSGLDSENIPSPLPIGIRLVRQNNVPGIIPQGLTGSFCLLDGTTVQIAPKIGNICFLELLSFIQSGKESRRKEYEGIEYGLNDDPSGASERLYESFFRCLSQYFGEGLLTARFHHLGRGSTARGQINYVKTTLGILSRSQKPVHYRAKLRSTDLAIHRVIRQVAEWVYSNLDSQSRTIHSTTIGKVQQVFGLTKDVRSDVQLFRELASRPEEFSQRPYLAQTLYYSSVILGEMGISLGEESEIRIKGDGYLINTNKVFEDFCRKIVSSALIDCDYLVGGPELSRKYLYDDFTFRLNPDIIAKKGEVIALIADAKYKEVDQSDHYQMHVYLDSFGLKTGFFISPATTAAETGGTYKTSSNGFRICEIKINVSDINGTIDLVKQHLTGAVM